MDGGREVGRSQREREERGEGVVLRRERESDGFFLHPPASSSGGRKERVRASASSNKPSEAQSNPTEGSANIGYYCM